MRPWLDPASGAKAPLKVGTVCMPNKVPPAPMDVATFATGPRTDKVLAVGEVPERTFSTVLAENGMMVLTLTGVFFNDFGLAPSSFAFWANVAAHIVSRTTENRRGNRTLNPIGSSLN